MGTLNEKIQKVIVENSLMDNEWWKLDNNGLLEASKEIEKLILKEKIDLLEGMTTQKDFDAIVLNIPIRVYNLRMELLRLNN